MKLALTAASLLLIAGGAVACGSDDSDSAGDDTSTSASASASESASAESSDDSADAGDTDESTTTFCTAFADFNDALSQAGSASESEQIQILKDEAEKLGDVDTPDGIPDDAKNGFETVIDAIADLPDDATTEDLTALESELSDEEKANADAFDAYLQETCPELGGASAEASPAPSLSVSPAPSAESTPSE